MNQEESFGSVTKSGKTSRSSKLSQKSLSRQTGLVNSHEHPVPFCKLAVTGNVVECNDLFEKLTGLAEGQLLERHFCDLIERNSHRTIENALLSSSEVPAFVVEEFVWLKQLGEDAIPISVIVRCVRDRVGRIDGYNLGLFDESHSQNKIAVAEKEMYELRKKEKLQDEFIAVASHELRTPIQPILGYALLARKKRISEEMAWDAVLKEARRLQQLANDILDVSRIDSGALECHIRPEKINEIIIALAESSKAELHNGVSIHVKHDPSEAQIEVDLDRPRIVQVLTNLLVNALKFTDSGSVTLATKAYLDKNLFEIEVSDTGKGIPAEVQPILFEKFATKGHGDASQNKGTGLGLYICKAIISAHSGTITARNTECGGATFQILLPISQKITNSK